MVALAAAIAFSTAPVIKPAPPLSMTAAVLSQLTPRIYAVSAETDMAAAAKMIGFAATCMTQSAAYLADPGAYLKVVDDKIEQRNRDHYQVHRGHLLRSLAWTQHRLQRRGLPYEALVAKDGALDRRFPRRSDFAAPAADPFAAGPSSEGVKAGGLEFSQ